MPLWPWWLGALGFAAVAVLHLVVLRRPLGVSGLLRTAISPTKRREERDAVELDDGDLQRAREEATRRAFAGTPLPVVTDGDATTAAASHSHHAPAPLPWSRAVLFLGGLVGGGALAALLQGDGAIEVLPHGLYQRIFGGNGSGIVSVVGPVVALTVGGVFWWASAPPWGAAARRVTASSGWPVCRSPPSSPRPASSAPASSSACS